MSFSNIWGKINFEFKIRVPFNALLDYIKLIFNCKL